MEPLGVAGIPFGSSSGSVKKRPPKVDRAHFYHNPGKDGVASGTSTSMSRENSGSATKSSSSSGMSMSISSASHTKMDTSCASIPESLNLNNSSISMSMSIDSRDTMTHLARKIEPVIHENIEFAPLDMTPGEELNLRYVPHMNTIPIPIPMFRLAFKFLTFLCLLFVFTAYRVRSRCRQTSV